MKKYTLIALVAIAVFSCDMITKDVQSEVDDLKAEIVLLSSQIQQLQSEINTLENSQQSDKASLESQISTLEQSITTFLRLRAICCSTSSINGAARSLLKSSSASMIKTS